MSLRRLFGGLVALLILVSIFNAVLAEGITIITNSEGAVVGEAPQGSAISFREAAGEYSISGADINNTTEHYGIEAINSLSEPLSIESDVNVTSETSGGIGASGNVEVVENGNVTAENSTGVVVVSGADVTVNGDITAEAGVRAADGGSAEVTGNITTEDFAVYADDASVTVTGNVQSDESYAIISTGESTVTVTGNVSSDADDREAVVAVNKSAVIITGDVEGQYSTVVVSDGSTADVTGDVSSETFFAVSGNNESTITVNGDVENTSSYAAVFANNDSSIIVTGDITNTGGIGAEALNDSTIVVEGQIKDGNQMGAYAVHDATISVGLDVDNTEDVTEIIEGIKDAEDLAAYDTESEEPAVQSDVLGLTIQSGANVLVIGDVEVSQEAGNSMELMGVLVASDDYGMQEGGILGVGDATGLVAGSVDVNAVVKGPDDSADVVENDSEGTPDVVEKDSVNSADAEAVGILTYANTEDATAIVSQDVTVFVDNNLEGLATATALMQNVFGGDASIDVGGSVQTEVSAADGDASGTGIYIRGNEGNASAAVGEALLVDVQSADGEASGTGISVDTGMIESVVTIGEGVTVITDSQGDDAESTGVSLNIIGGGSTIEIGGDISVSAESSDGSAEAAGVTANINAAEVLMEVGGGISVMAGGETMATDAVGLSASVTDDAVFDIQIGGDITVSTIASTDNHNEPQNSSYIDNVEKVYERVGEDKYPEGDGVNLQVLDGTINAEINGSVITENIKNGYDGSSAGVSIISGSNVFSDSHYELEDGTKLVYGEDYYYQYNEETQTTEFTVDAKYAGETLVQVTEYESTAGKGEINLNILEDEYGVGGDIVSEMYGLVVAYYGDGDNTTANVLVEGEISAPVGVLVNEHVTEENFNLTVWQVSLTETEDGEHAVVTYNDDDESEYGFKSTEETEKIEKAINYIIKVEDATTVSASADTAHEGETVTVQVNVPDGYHLTGAFNGLGERVPLQKDAGGNYYVVVPRGGGVYLSATFDPNHVDNNDDGGRPERTERKKKKTAAETSTVYVENVYSLIQENEAQILSSLTAEQQVAVILTKCGYDGALKSFGFTLSDRAREVMNSINSDLSALINTESIDGAEWKVINMKENGKRVKYCFRMTSDGSWMTKIVR